MKSSQLIYCILCDDVRIEMGNKLSLMGIFENMFFPAFPGALLKFAVVNHWVGFGEFETQVRIAASDGKEVAASNVSTFRMESQGYSDNVTFFANVSFERPGTYSVRTFIDGKQISERPLFVHLIQQAPSTVN